MSRLLAALAVGAVALAGCGEGDPPTSPGGTNDATELTLRLDADGPGGATAQTATLTCPEDGGDACAAVDSLPSDPATPTAADQACTQVYGGPDTLTVNGTLRGDRIAASFTRTDGCEIERFDRFADLLAAVFPDYRGGTSVDVN